jgi:hypothetical protein
MTWIKMETSLRTHPKVVTLASRLSVTRVTVLGGLCHAWMIADEHADENGVIPFLDLAAFDSLVELPGLGKALVDMGWLMVTDDGIEFPNYLEHNGSTAKARAQAQRRQSKSRSKKPASRSCHAPVTPDRDARVTREEKNREDKYKTKPKEEAVILPFPSFEFSEAWKRWESHRKEKRKPITPTSRAQQLKKLGQMSERAAIEMIDYTIFKGWEGLREPEESKPRRGTIEANNPEPVNYGTPGFTPARYP